MIWFLYFLLLQKLTVTAGEQTWTVTIQSTGPHVPMPNGISQSATDTLVVNHVTIRVQTQQSGLLQVWCPDPRWQATCLDSFNVVSLPVEAFDFSSTNGFAISRNAAWDQSPIAKQSVSLGLRYPVFTWRVEQGVFDGPY